jgi:MFS family permease
VANIAEQSAETRRSGLRAVPRGIWALGFVSMFMDLSSEMIHALLPVFLVTVLGASATTVGLIEGIAEATAMIVKIFSGMLSDWLGRRKLLAVIGYGLAAFTKPLFPLAAAPAWVFAARFLDRIGKGIRGAPRDALVADLAPPHLRGACYGLRQSLDTIGAFAGPLLAAGLMVVTADSYRVVFWIAVIPAFIAVAALIVGVEDRPTGDRAAKEARSPIRLADVRSFGVAYGWTVAIYVVFTLARFSEAFLVLRVTDLGLPAALAPMVLVAMNVAYFLSAYPAGVASDRLSRRGILGVGLAVLIAADVVVALSSGLIGLLAGVALWGLHMGLTQGVFAALVADAAPPERRGTAFGLLNLAGGLATLLASLVAGALWDVYGASATFLAGAGFALVAALGTALSVHVLPLKRHGE